MTDIEDDFGESSKKAGKIILECPGDPKAKAVKLIEYAEKAKDVIDKE